MPDPARTLRIAEEFEQGLSSVYSPRVLGQVRHLLEILPSLPEMGSSNVRECLVERYGPGIRKLPVSNFVIVYRIDGEFIDILALVYGPGVV